MIKRTICAVMSMIMLVTAGAFAVQGAGSYDFVLRVNGESNAQIGIEEEAQVTMTIESDGNYDFYSMQDYIKFDPEYFELDTGSIRVKTVIVAGQEQDLMNYSPIENNGVYDRVFVNRASLSPQPFGGSEEIISFTLKPLKKGTTEITHYRTEMLGQNNERYTVNEVSAAVVIGDGGSVTETTTETTTVTETTTESTTVTESTTATTETTTEGTTETTTETGTETTTQSAGGSSTSGGGGGASTATYTVTFVVNGERTTQSVRSGESIERPEDPVAEGYIFEGWYSDMAYITEYDFSQAVTRNITLYGKMSAVQETGEGQTEAVSEEGTSAYTDVGNEDWFKNAVDYVTEKGLMVGISENEFAPRMAVTRGMFVTVIHRMEGTPEAESEASFKDVEEGSWYEEAVNWAAENYIVYGYSAEEYGPGDIITREQMAAIIYRYAEYKGIDMSVENENRYMGYNDHENISNYAKPAVSWVSEKGLMAGDADGGFRPKDKATRAETAQVFMNVVENMGGFEKAVDAD